MSAKRSKSTGRREFSLETAAETLREWEALRTARDSAGGTLETSEALLSQITGKLTDREAAQGLVNELERQAAVEIAEWRQALVYEPAASDAAQPRPDLSKELIRFYELWRAVLATGDRELAACWMQEQSWSAQLVIRELFPRNILPTS